MNDVLAFLTKFCKDNGLDPYKRGNNQIKLKNPNRPFNLKNIRNFPLEKLNEIKEIQKIISNLNSQHNTKMINRVILVLESYLLFLVCNGVDDCESEKIFVVYQGNIYEINSEYNIRKKKYSYK